MQAWERFVAFLEKKSLTLAGIYSHAKLLAWTGNTVEVGFPREFALGVDADKIALVKGALAEFTGGAVDLKVRTIDGVPTGASVADVEGARQTAEREQRMAEARGHPATQAVIDTFGAAIKEIKVDG